MVKKRFSHYTCCKLRDLGGQENWSKKWCQKSSIMAPQSSFGHPGIRFLRFWEDLIEVRILMVFWASKKMKKIWKNEAEAVRKTSACILREGSAAEVGPVEAFGVWEFRDLQNTEFGLTRRVWPPEGSGGSMGYRLFRRPPTFRFVCSGIWIVGFRFFVLSTIIPDSSR